MRFARANRTAPHRAPIRTPAACARAAALLVVAGLGTLTSLPLPAAGVTLITHGNGGTTSGWVTGMANALSARLGGNLPIYRIDVTSTGGGLTNTITKVGGGNPLSSPAGELILMLDWGPVSSGGTNTFQVANVVAPLFWQTNLIAELDGHPLADFPIHLVGHSRGGSLVCEVSRKLGERGIWVDHVTNLDTYPVSGDAPAASYENVLFSESYYQKINAFIKGDPVPGSFARKQTEADGGYSGFLNIYNGHSDVHLWYHGTIDLNTPYQLTMKSRSPPPCGAPGGRPSSRQARMRALFTPASGVATA